MLDGGPCLVGVESTIVDLTIDPPAILRPGGTSSDLIADILGHDVEDESGGPSRAPGMLASHYAPRAAVEIVEDAAVAADRVVELRRQGRAVLLLDPGPDSGRYAHGLYSWLRDADDRHIEVVVVVPPPADALGRAVRDRLRKAAAPRPADDGTPADDAT